MTFGTFPLLVRTLHGGLATSWNEICKQNFNSKFLKTEKSSLSFAEKGRRYVVSSERIVLQELTITKFGLIIARGVKIEN